MKQAAKSGLRALAWVWLVGETSLIGAFAAATAGIAAGPAAGVAAAAAVMMVWCLAIKRSSFVKLLKSGALGGRA